MTDASISDKRTLRQQLRARRQALTPEQQKGASRAAARLLRTTPEWVRSRHIALYWPNDGEIDPRSLAEQLWQVGKHCYLPVLHPTQTRRLWFVEWRPGALLTPNRFGIPEPDPHSARRLPARFLDLVLMPLVGFDRCGGRLGMGGGFYDCTFSFTATETPIFTKRANSKHIGNRGPTLFALSHACQEVPVLPREPWDIPVRGIVTDQEVIRERTGHPHTQSNSGRAV